MTLAQAQAASLAFAPRFVYADRAARDLRRFVLAQKRGR